jgi:translation initiation factor IF-2
MPLSKIRVYELAKMLGKSNKELLNILDDLGIEVRSHMSSIDTDTAQLIEESIGSEQKKPLEEKGEKGSSAEDQKKQEIIKVPAGATVKEVADMIGVTPADAVKQLVTSGLMVPATMPASEEVLVILSDHFGVDLEIVEAEEIEAENAAEQMREIRKKKKEVIGDNATSRSPVVTVMGHVDHGKTTLLDHIRKTNVTESEAGGITQHIGASTVVHHGKQIVFLDTPGHEAFTSMRARGTQVTDIAILVVAADDGLMPQTEEAINHAKAAGVPIIVAVNKIDKPGARPDRVRQQLSDKGLVPEEWGGNTIMVDVSAKTGEGIDQLLEMLLLLSEMEELRADATINAEGTVVESRLDKGKGPVATVLIKQGTLHTGDVILMDTAWGKIRAMLDSKGEQVKSACPSTAVEILGLNSVPQPGEAFVKVENEKVARDETSAREQARREDQKLSGKRMTLEELYAQMQDGGVPQLNLVLKCDVQGSIEAVESSVNKLVTSEVGITFVHKGAGRVSESDVMLAAASNAIIIAFNVRPDNNAKKIAEREGVQIRTYKVIYDLIDDVKAALEGMLKPVIREEILGQAEVREIFKVPKIGKIAGCYVTEGVIKRNAKARVISDGVVKWEGSLDALRRFKDDAREVSAGYECGINLHNFQDLSEGDIIESFQEVEERRTLE